MNNTQHLGTRSVAFKPPSFATILNPPYFISSLHYRHGLQIDLRIYWCLPPEHLNTEEKKKKRKLHHILVFHVTMTKKNKRKQPDAEEILARPWCYYCERDFDDLKILISHQKARHFKCERCGRRLNTAGGELLYPPLFPPSAYSPRDADEPCPQF